ncbi:MAG: hypothetical protein E7185_00355 [Erysipelotrichaceae bacterium]|nr:hypothetical protein [Erysipelotrichaceae bacterium]
MKKTYEKPIIGLDLFALLQSAPIICDYSSAAGMGTPTQGNGDDCTWYMDEDNIIFLQSKDVCNWKWEDGEWDIFCYNGPYPGMEIFGS